MRVWPVDRPVRAAITVISAVTFFLFLLALPTGSGRAEQHLTVEPWKIVVLIYTKTDFSYTDQSNQQRRLVAEMTETEKRDAVTITTRFVEQDIPALTSGAMRPSIEIRYASEPLRSLTSGLCDDYVPSPDDVTDQQDSTFDSLIVIWDGSGTDVYTGKELFVSGCAYAWPMGTGQLYSVTYIDFLNRNVLKHEWGHSIVFYFDAAGTAPVPAVDNHEPKMYVNCITGEPYVLVDETDDEPIPNSIYNNDSGFTHDYYSGTIATIDEPSRCIGITRQAWASGGPATRPLAPQGTTIFLPHLQK